jgi:hypothetical protein
VIRLIRLACAHEKKNVITDLSVISIPACLAFRDALQYTIYIVWVTRNYINADEVGLKRRAVRASLRVSNYGHYGTIETINGKHRPLIQNPNAG